MKFNFNVNAENLILAFGLTKERVDELAEVMKENIKNSIEVEGKDDIPTIVLPVIELAQTPEETAFIAFKLGGAIDMIGDHIQMLKLKNKTQD